MFYVFFYTYGLNDIEYDKHKYAISYNLFMERCRAEIIMELF